MPTRTRTTLRGKGIPRLRMRIVRREADRAARRPRTRSRRRRTRTRRKRKRVTLRQHPDEGGRRNRNPTHPTQMPKSSTSLSLLRALLTTRKGKIPFLRLALRLSLLRLKRRMMLLLLGRRRRIRGGKRRSNNSLMTRRWRWTSSRLRLLPLPHSHRRSRNHVRRQGRRTRIWRTVQLLALPPLALGSRTWCSIPRSRDSERLLLLSESCVHVVSFYLSLLLLLPFEQYIVLLVVCLMLNIDVSSSLPSSVCPYAAMRDGTYLLLLSWLLYDWTEPLCDSHLSSLCEMCTLNNWRLSRSALSSSFLNWHFTTGT